MYARSCSTPNIYFPPQYAIDDIPGWLAEIMTEPASPGRSSSWARSGIHAPARARTCCRKWPRTTSVRTRRATAIRSSRSAPGPGCAKAGAMRQYEDWVRETHVAAFGKDGAFSGNNCYFGPQHVASPANAPAYMYMIAAIPGSVQPSGTPGRSPSASGDELLRRLRLIYSRDELFAQRLAALDRFLRQRSRTRPLLTIFGCHPGLRHVPRLAGTPRLRTGEARTVSELGWHFGTKPRHEEAHAQQNFAGCASTSKPTDLQVGGSRKRPPLRRATGADQPRCADFHAVARPAGSRPAARYVLAAELVCGFAESCRPTRRTRSARRSDPRNVLARRRGRGRAGTGDVTHAELVALSEQVLRAVEAEGCLPANSRRLPVAWDCRNTRCWPRRPTRPRPLR